MKFCHIPDISPHSQLKPSEHVPLHDFNLLINKMSLAIPSLLIRVILIFQGVILQDELLLDFLVEQCHPVIVEQIQDGDEQFQFGFE